MKPGVPWRLGSRRFFPRLVGRCLSTMLVVTLSLTLLPGVWTVRPWTRWRALNILEKDWVIGLRLVRPNGQCRHPSDCHPPKNPPWTESHILQN